MATLQRPGSDREDVDAGDSVVHVVLSGLTYLVPIVLTVYLVKVALGIFADAIAPLVVLLEFTGVSAYLQQNWLVDLLVRAGVYGSVDAFLTEAFAVLLLGITVVALGVVGNMDVGHRATGYVADRFADLPIVGTLYETADSLERSVVADDSDLRDVKLVEFPQADAYTLGFETAAVPDAIADAAGEDDLVTLFLPMAPNPITGGHLVHVPADRVADVDMTVEEGMEHIVTTGMGDGAGE